MGCKKSFSTRVCSVLMFASLDLKKGFATMGRTRSPPRSGQPARSTKQVAAMRSAKAKYASSADEQKRLRVAVALFEQGHDEASVASALQCCRTEEEAKAWRPTSEIIGSPSSMAEVMKLFEQGLSEKEVQLEMLRRKAIRVHTDHGAVPAQGRSVPQDVRHEAHGGHQAQGGYHKTVSSHDGAARTPPRRTKGGLASPKEDGPPKHLGLHALLQTSRASHVVREMQPCKDTLIEDGWVDDPCSKPGRTK